MSWHLVGYTPWEAENVTVDGTTYLGVIAHYYAVSTVDGSTRPGPYITLPDGTPAKLCIGSTCVMKGDSITLNYCGPDYGWVVQPSTRWIEYVSDAELPTYLARFVNAQNGGTICAQPNETISLITSTSSTGNPGVKISVLTSPIHISEAQVQNLEGDLQTLYGNFLDYYTKTDIDTTLNNYYTKTYIDTNYYEKVEIDGQVSDLTALANTKMPLKYSDYTTIPDGANIGYGTTAGSYTTPGVYVRTTSSAGIAGRPSDYQSAFLLIVRNTSAESRYQQELYPLANVSGSVQHFFYKRYYTAAGWQDWSKFEGTATTPYIPTP